MANSSETFQSVIENNKGIIYKVANAYCKNEEDRKDLIQEILIQIWKSFNNFNHQAKYSTWIYRIALNVSISFYRKSSKNKVESFESFEFIQYSFNENNSREIEDQETILYKCIKELKEIDRALILLYLDGKTQKEISEILGLTTNNISTKIYRIKELLKEKLINNKIDSYAG